MALRVDDVDLGRDRSLVEQFQAGDEGAFDDLYRRYFPRLYRYCLKRVGDTHEAEELAQEAFTRAYRHLDRFAGDRRFYPWMTVIAGRLCVDTHRRRARSQPSDDIDLGAVEGGQDAIVNRVDLAVLARAIDNLAPRHREVIDLRERQGYTYQQIADHYGVTLGTVEALLWRARKALRREFLALTGGEAPSAALPILGIVMARLRHAGQWLRFGRPAGRPSAASSGTGAEPTVPPAARRLGRTGAGALQPLLVGVAGLALAGGVILGGGGSTIGRPLVASAGSGHTAVGSPTDAHNGAGGFGSSNRTSRQTTVSRSTFLSNDLAGGLIPGGSGTHVGTWRQAANQAKGYPVKVEVGGVGVGVDPGGAMGQTNDLIRRLPVPGKNPPPPR
jgi:RNA polymerase sigma-70 factor (ECF subfamily)